MTTTFAKDDEVVLDPAHCDAQQLAQYPGVWTVEKTNPTTYKLVQGMRRLTAPHYMVAAPGSVIVEDVPIPEFFDLGELLAPSSPRGRKMDPKGTYVVCAHSSGGRIRVALLGGEAGRYWSVAPDDMTRVQLADLPARLAG